MNPGRAMSKEGRPIHDMRGAHPHGSKNDHPPAKQPRHGQAARAALWRAARHPGAGRVVAKRGVARAFKWHALHPEDAGEFGTYLPGQTLGLEGGASWPSAWP